MREFLAGTSSLAALSQLKPIAIRIPKPRDPEHQATIADSVSLALLVVLETLDLAERLAFVLHDMFDVPFDEIAPIVAKTPAATWHLASRARRRVQGAAMPPDANLRAQREVVAAFMARAAVTSMHYSAWLDPDVVVRMDRGTQLSVVRGTAPLAKASIIGAQLAASVRMVLVNGAPGFVGFDEKGEPLSVIALTVRSGRITEVDVLGDPDRLRQFDLSALAE
jgi:RNA polymerase sigma-70 factor, ECF subfamily